MPNSHAGGCGGGSTSCRGCRGWKVTFLGEHVSWYDTFPFIQSNTNFCYFLISLIFFLFALFFSKILFLLSTEIRTPVSAIKFGIIVSKLIALLQMNGILGTIQLVLDTKLTIEQLDYVLTMKHSADSLLSVINDILLFSKLEANQFKLHSTVFRVEHLLEGVGGLLSSLVNEKQLGLYFLIEESMPYHLIGDVDRLQQILVNMIGNSVKFTNPSGEVMVACSVTCSTCYIRSVFGTNEISSFVVGGGM